MQMQIRSIQIQISACIRIQIKLILIESSFI